MSYDTRYYANVTNLALCQKCPRLAFYAIFMKRKTNFVGIQGTGFYGSVFHSKIAARFFDAASDFHSKLNDKIANSLKHGYESFHELIRKDFFFEFVKSEGKNYPSSQIYALAAATETWLKVLWEALSEMPSLMRFPREIMPIVFQKQNSGNMQSSYDLEIDGVQTELTVVGKYDALIFNPDEKQARIFEFKGYKKSDVTVPLTQSVIYAWLVHEKTGIYPEIEIVHLSESENPANIFSSGEVHEMIKSALPNLFETICRMYTLKEIPPKAYDSRLCEQCKYRNFCEAEIELFIRNHENTFDFERKN